MGALSLYILTIFIFIRTEAVPPAACFANFRWDDCGQSPVSVMYYWKPGSRCEVGLWRGCLPNLNMFQDEYECVSTCIFTTRAIADDYHSFNENEIYDSHVATEATNVDDIVALTTSTGDHSTDITTVSSNDTVMDDNGTTIEGTATTPIENEDAATTVLP